MHAPAALAVVLCTLIAGVGCTAPDLQHANIGNPNTMSPGGPIQDPPLSAGELKIAPFQDRLDGIRAGLSSFLPTAPDAVTAIHIDETGTPPECAKLAPQGPDIKACLEISFSSPIDVLGPVTIWLANEQITSIDDSSLLATLGYNVVPLLDPGEEVESSAFADLLVFHDPSAPITLEFQHNPANIVAVAGPQPGVRFPVTVKFDDDFLSSFFCDCDDVTASPLPLPQGGCNDLCTGLLGKLPPFLGTCNIELRVRLNEMMVALRLTPTLPATKQGVWTSQLFPGAKDFHLPYMFDLPLFVDFLGGSVGIHDSVDEVDDDQSSGLAISATAYGCGPFCYSSCENQIAQNAGLLGWPIQPAGTRRH